MFGGGGEGGVTGKWGTWEVGGGLDQGGRACGLSDGICFGETGIWKKREEKNGLGISRPLAHHGPWAVRKK